MDAQNIKKALAGRAEEFAHWLFPAGRKSGNEWLVGSLNGEQGKSLSICIGGSKVGVFADFATGAKGDNLLELYAQARQVGFKDALCTCSEWLGTSAMPAARTVMVPRQKPSSRACNPSDIYEPSDQDIRAVQKMVETLVSDPSLCERVANRRGWKPETIRQLGLETHLGWQDGNVCFIYDTGAKLRPWRTGSEKVIWWAFGRPWLWRGAWIKQAQTVWVSEGEPDCISVIDAGIETDSRTVAVAIPSASTFADSWVELFVGKDVILAFDNDKAGLEATARVSSLLLPWVRSLKGVNWKGVLQHAS